MRFRKTHIGLLASLVVLILVVVSVPFWLRPLIEGRASLALGRSVTIGHLAIGVRPLRMTLDEVMVAGDPAIPDPAYFAKLDHLVLSLDLAPLIHGRMFAIPEIDVAGLDVQAIQNGDGANNYRFPGSGSSTGTTLPAIGVLRVSDSQAHLVMPEFGTDAHLAIRTEDTPDGRIIADISGTYHGQPITGRLAGAAILSLRDAADPYSLDLALANGQTHVGLTGTIVDPLHLGGAHLTLTLAGQDMADLYPLLGVPFPPTTPFNLTSQLGYENGKIELTGINGHLGNTDLNGDLTIDPAPQRPVMSGALWSARVDLDDLAGFIGSTPGNTGTPDESAAQKRQLARAIASPRLIPTVQMDLPRLRSADFHMTYRADSIIGRSVPFDTVGTALDIDDGHIVARDFRVGIGKGQILAQIDMTPVDDTVHTVATIQMQKLDIARMLASTHLIQGGGVLGGDAAIDSTGKSLAEILGNANGHVTLIAAGGDVSAIAVDLSGLKLGSAVLSALGFPDRAQINCLIGDWALTNGVMQTRTVLLDTTDARSTMVGTLDLKTELMAAQLRTQSKHFTVGTFSAPIAITGMMKDLSFRPDAGSLGARTAAAIGLAVLFPPAALLPTIQFGIGEDNACIRLIKQAAAHETPAKPAQP